MAAVSFLTRIPVRSEPFGPDLGRASPWFPLVGSFLGMLAVGVYRLGYGHMPTPLAALAAVGLTTLLTGALHEDGLADTADALGSGAVGERALEIMRDSRLGTHGVLGLVFAIVWKVTAIASLGPLNAAAALVMSHTLGRGGAVVLMASSPAARADGLGHAAASGVTPGRALLAAGSALVLAALAGGWWAFPCALLVGLAALVTRRAALSRFGGATGDVLGACEQVGELVVLAYVSIVVWGGSRVWWDL